MGTRADFYIGRGENAEWLGSIAFDGYPDGIPPVIFLDTSADRFRADVAAEIASRDDGTTPEMGWPWPWETSSTTDYAYALDDGKVWASGFGGGWFDPLKPDDDNEENHSAKSAVFPDMSSRKNTTFGKRSGLLIIGG